MKNKILDMLRASSEYISGENMSRELGISRAAVWKHIKKLRDDGYEIFSVTNKGYKLKNEPERMDMDRFSALLTTKKIARCAEYMRVTDSTNEAAKRNATYPDGSLFAAEIQTAGKGRRGGNWNSQGGSGIWMSLLLKPELPPQSISQITLIAGMAVRRALGRGALIKWPNDIVIGTKKVCGILTEMSAEADIVDHVVCGIGINVNTESFPDELSEKATSLFLETGKRRDRETVMAAVANEFEPMYETFVTRGFEPLREEYREHCITIGKFVRLTHRNTEVTGIAADIDEKGALIVDTGDGSIIVDSGEVSVRGLYGYV